MEAIDQLKQQIAARFKKFREEENLSQDKLAGATGTNRTTISKYEVGVYTIPSDFILELKKKYNLNIDWLLSGEGFRKNEVSKNSTILSDIRTLNDNNLYLNAELKSLKKEFYKLHKDFYAQRSGTN